jgi:hypothetical protein
MTTTFTITGQAELTRRLTAIGQAPVDILRDTGLHAVREAKLLVPRRTGNLGRTIRIGALTPTYVEVKAGGTSQVGYAAAVEFGSRAHVIVPRVASVLAWGGPRTLGGRLRAGGRPTNFARRVNHPGSRARPYLIPGLEKALQITGLDRLVAKWNGAA